MNQVKILFIKVVTILNIPNLQPPIRFSAQKAIPRTDSTEQNSLNLHIIGTNSTGNIVWASKIDKLLSKILSLFLKIFY